MIDKNIIALGWVSFFTDMASSMITTILPVFVVYVLHEGVDKLGIILAIATFVSYIFRVLFGYISDRYKIVKPFVVAGYLISALVKPLLAWSHSFADVAFLRASERMGKAVRSASKDSLISAYAQNNAHGKTFGFHKMMDIGGELSGALLIFFFFFFFTKDESTIRTIFSLTFIPGFIATFIVLFYVKDVPKKVEKPKVFNTQDYRLLPLLLGYFFFLFFIVGDQFFIVYAKETGFTLQTIPLLVVLFTLVQTMVSYYGGILSDKIGPEKILLYAFIFGIASIATMKVSIWLAYVFLALFTVLSLNGVRSYISANAISKGFVFGVFYAGVAFFSSLGALAVGFIWQYFGIDNTIKFSLIGMSTAVCLFGFYFKDKLLS